MKPGAAATSDGGSAAGEGGSRQFGGWQVAFIPQVEGQSFVVNAGNREDERRLYNRMRARAEKENKEFDAVRNTSSLYLFLGF